MFINKKANADSKVEIKSASAIIGIAFVQESKTDKILTFKWSLCSTDFHKVGLHRKVSAYF